MIVTILTSKVIMEAKSSHTDTIINITRFVPKFCPQTVSFSLIYPIFIFKYFFIFFEKFS